MPEHCTYWRREKGVKDVKILCKLSCKMPFSLRCSCGQVSWLLSCITIALLASHVGASDGVFADCWCAKVLFSLHASVHASVA